MAKKKTDEQPEVGDVVAADLSADAPPADPRDAEIERLRAELAAAKAGGPVYGDGRRYLVRLKDGPAAVVECGPGEHPFEAYKRATGVIHSMHAPEIHATEEPVGLVK